MPVIIFMLILIVAAKAWWLIGYLGLLAWLIWLGWRGWRLALAGTLAWLAVLCLVGLVVRRHQALRQQPHPCHVIHRHHCEPLLRVAWDTPVTQLRSGRVTGV